MNKRIHSAFNSVHASQTLKDNTLHFLIDSQPKIAVPKTAGLRRLAAACVILVLLASGFATLYFVPVSAIHIDTDPTSAQLKINCFDRVVEIYGDSTDSNVKHMHYKDAVSCLLGENENEDTVIAVVGDDKMLTAIEQQAQHHENVHCRQISKHCAQQAAHSGMSAAKYEAYQQLLASGASITAEEAKQMSMKQLRSLLDGATPTRPDSTVAVVSEHHTEAPTVESNANQNGKHHGKNHHG